MQLACVTISTSAFELEIHGPVNLEFPHGLGTSSTELLTVEMWINVVDIAAGSQLIISIYNITVEIREPFVITLNGKTYHTSLQMKTWLQFIFVLDKSARSMVVYKGRDLLLSVDNLESTITDWFSMSISVRNGDTILLRSISVMTIKVNISNTFNDCQTPGLPFPFRSLLDMRRIGTTGQVDIRYPSSCPKPRDQACTDETLCPKKNDPCIGNICTNGASCNSSAANYVCICLKDYDGEFCQIKITAGKYSPWSSWSDCSTACGIGIKRRSRVCNNPEPSIGGLACTDPDANTSECNSGTCSDCDTLQLTGGYNATSPICTGDTSDLRCIHKCEAGLFTSKSQPQIYRCMKDIWSPTTQLPHCFHLVPPTSLTITVEANLTSSSCSPQHLNAMRDDITTHLLALTCNAKPICTSQVVVAECQPGRATATSYSHFTVKLGNLTDLDMELYVSHGVMSLSLKSLVDAVDILEETGREILAAAHSIFSVSAGNLLYTPELPIRITPEVICPTGFFSENGFCSACPSGTFFNETTKLCKLCPIGTFQASPGKLGCQPCPYRKTTLYSGSTSCTVDVSSTTSTHTPSTSYTVPTSAQEIKRISTVLPVVAVAGDNMLVIIICALVALILLIVLIVGGLIVRSRRQSVAKHKTKQEAEGLSNDGYIQPIHTEHIYAELNHSVRYHNGDNNTRVEGEEASTTVKDQRPDKHYSGYVIPDPLASNLDISFQSNTHQNGSMLYNGERVNYSVGENGVTITYDEICEPVLDDVPKKNVYYHHVGKGQYVPANSGRVDAAGTSGRKVDIDALVIRNDSPMGDL